MKKKNFIFAFLFYFALAFLVYGGLPKTFFQQDEWAVFGNLLYWQKADLNWFERLFVYEQNVHILPFSNLFSYLEFNFWGLNFAPYAIFSIWLQVLNALLVFYLSYLILEKKRLSLAVGLLFAFNSFSHQAVTWAATTGGTAGSCLFLLLSLICFARRRFILSFLMVVFSLGFKETSLFLLLVMPLFWLMFSQKLTLREGRKVLLPLLFLGLLYFGLRLFLFINLPSSPIAVEAISQPASLMVYLYRFFTLPLKAISQSLVPAGLILSLSRAMVKLAYPHFIMADGLPNPYLVETVAADMVSYALAVMILVLAFLTFSYLQNRGENRLGRCLIFSLLFIVFGCWPFIFVPGQAGYFSLFEPRHFYILGFGSSLFLVVMVFSLGLWLASFFLPPPRMASTNLGGVLSVLFLIPIFCLHVSKIRTDIGDQVEIGQLRKGILEQISATYPRLPKKVVFYLESDKAFYGLPEEEKIPPFQSGFGQTLLVWYNFRGESFPACFYQGKYLYVLLSQGYKECRGRGFGYFRQFDKLASAVEENDLSKNSVISFSYDSQTQALTDISPAIRGKL